MMSLSALWALARRVPRVAWMIAAAVVAIPLLYAGILYRGRLQERAAHAAAVHRDSTAHQVVKVDSAQRHTDVAVQQARAAIDTASRRRQTRAELRDAAAPAILTAPAALQDLIRFDDLQAVLEAHKDTIVLAAFDSGAVERKEHAKLDTLNAHEPVFEPPGSGGVSLGVVAMISAAVLGVLAIIRTLLH